MTKRVFGELELTILKMFQSHGITQPLTVRDILEALGAQDKYTTIMTVMNRMVEKKLLIREKSGHQYEYWINESKTASEPSLLGRLKQKLFGGKSVSMASYLIESSDVSDEELAEMEKLIKEIRLSRKKP